MIIFTAIFGFYDILKKPLVITPGWRYVAFTDQDFSSEVWEIIKVPLINDDPVLTARYYKIMFHEHISDEFSIWIDGSFTINCNLDKFMAGNFKSPMTVVKHPLRDCIYREADICIQQKRGDRKDIERQIEVYRAAGIPKQAGLIQSGILIRQNVFTVKEFCRCWWEQIKEFSKRDQIGFNIPGHKYGWPHQVVFDYRSSKEFIFKKHIHVKPYGVN